MPDLVPQLTALQFGLSVSVAGRFRHVELRNRLRLFSDGTAAAMPLDTELGCTSAAPADPAPAEIPAEGRTKRKPKRAGTPR